MPHVSLLFKHTPNKCSVLWILAELQSGGVKLQFWGCVPREAGQMLCFAKSFAESSPRLQAAARLCWFKTHSCASPPTAA